MRKRKSGSQDKNQDALLEEVTFAQGLTSSSAAT